MSEIGAHHYGTGPHCGCTDRRLQELLDEVRLYEDTIRQADDTRRDLELKLELAEEKHHQ